MSGSQALLVQDKRFFERLSKTVTRYLKRLIETAQVSETGGGTRRGSG